MRQLLMTYLVLLGLLTLTVGMSFVPTGALSLAVSLSIAVAKAALIVMVFMQLASSIHLIRVIAVAGLIWLWVLFSLSFSDYFFRPEVPYPTVHYAPDGDSGREETQRVPSPS